MIARHRPLDCGAIRGIVSWKRTRDRLIARKNLAGAPLDPYRSCQRVERSVGLRATAVSGSESAGRFFGRCASARLPHYNSLVNRPHFTAGIVELITFIKCEFDLAISDEDVTKEKLESILKMAEYIYQRRLVHS